MLSLPRPRFFLLALAYGMHIDDVAFRTLPFMIIIHKTSPKAAAFCCAERCNYVSLKANNFESKVLEYALQSNHSVLLAIPTYNEAENIEPILIAVWQAVPDLHVVIVDDNSSDGTAAIIKRLQTDAQGRLHLIERPGKLGLGTAYVTAFKWGLQRGYQAFIEMDADFSHDPQTLPRMIAELKNYDVVIGSRYVPGGGTENWSLVRKMISMGGGLYARTILGVSVKDLTGGFNAWQRKVLERIHLDTIRSEGYSFQIELKYRAILAGFTWYELPIKFSERRAGQSKMSGRIVLEAMRRVWILRRYTRRQLLEPKKP